jgi:polysaccharide biosynthesis transport protein
MLWRVADRRPSDPPGNGSGADFDGRWTGNSVNGQNLQFHQLICILRRRIGMILAIAGLGTAISAVVAIFVPPKYTATVQLVVEPQPVSPAGGRVASPIDEAVDTHVTLIGSRGHLRRVAMSLAQASGHEQTERSLHAGTEASSRILSANESSGNWLTELERRLGIWIEAFDRKGETLDRDLEELERSTKVHQERRSRVISVNFTATNRERATAWANRIGELYIDGQLEQQQAYMRSELARLNGRGTVLKREMESATLSAQKALQQRAGSAPNPSREERKADEYVRELERHAAATSQQYHALLRREKELRDHLDMVAPGIWIHSLASVPERPSSHNPLLLILPALIFFAIGGSLLAVVLDQLDRGMRSEREVSSVLGIPCIGLVPQLPARRRARPHGYLVAEPLSAYAEAIRSVFLALHLEPAPRICQVVLISSSLPGEGKSTLAVSLATYAALIGRRVLLMDLDVRHPSRHPILAGEGERGVADLLLSDCALGEAIQHIPDPGLDYLSITRRPIDPVELLADGEMSELIGRLRKSYDCILIDGPPVLGATEARLLALLADKVLWVVKWGSTRREIAQNALNQLFIRSRPGSKLSSRLLAVVAQVQLKKHARYRYGDISEMLARSRSVPAFPRREGQEPPPKMARQDVVEAEGTER